MSKRTTMEALACHVERKYNTLYFTENPPNAGINDDLFGYRYFLLFKNTFGIFQKYKTQEEAINGMTEILKEDPSKLIQLHSQLKAFTTHDDMSIHPNGNTGLLKLIVTLNERKDCTLSLIHI